MATNKEYIDFVCELIDNTFNVRYRKMFGEYMIYINDKPIIIVCDNVCYVKEKEEIKSLMENASLGVPYKGASLHYVLDIDNIPLLNEVICKLEKVTPIPKKNKRN